MCGDVGMTNGQARARIKAIKLSRETKQTGRDDLKECVAGVRLPNKLFFFFLMRYAIITEKRMETQQQRDKSKEGLQYTMKSLNKWVNMCKCSLCTASFHLCFP